MERAPLDRLQGLTTSGQWPASASRLLSALTGTIGRTRCDGCADPKCTVFTAIRGARASAGDSPLFGLTSKWGKLLLDISSRIRCPRLNKFAVAKGSMVIS